MYHLTLYQSKVNGLIILLNAPVFRSHAIQGVFVSAQISYSVVQPVNTMKKM